MDDQAKQSAFTMALVTEHSVLQSAASTTVSEASGRAALYLSALSSSLVALGFAAQSPTAFVPLAATVLPAILIMGLFTTVRLVDTGVQNVQFIAGMAKIRRYYRDLTPEAKEFFTPWGGQEADETSEALAELGAGRSWLAELFTAASMVAAINSLVTGVTVALVFEWIAKERLVVVAVILGILAMALAMLTFLRYQHRRYASADAAVLRTNKKSV